MKNLDVLENMVKELMGDEYEVSIQKLVKNNGVRHQAIIIRKQGMEIGVTVYIDDFLTAIDAGEIDAYEVAERIAGVYNGQQDMGEIVDITEKLDKESVLSKVVYQVINKEKNIDLLAETPHREFLDLAVVYRIIIGEGVLEPISFMITDTFCDMWGVSQEELDAAARKNTKSEGFYTDSLTAVLRDRYGVTGVPEAAEKEPTWVISTQNLWYGAAVMLYEDYFKEFAEEKGCDLYIMPSSIHEVMAIPAEIKEPDFLRKMVKKINETEVAPEEVLSDSLYRYDREAGISLVA